MQLSVAVTYAEEMVIVASPLASRLMVPPVTLEMTGLVWSAMVMDTELSALTLPEASVTRK